MPPVPKPAKPERGTRAAREWMALVAQLPCVICQSGDRVQLHHCIDGRFSQTKASDFDVLPLCCRHHTMKHNAPRRWSDLYGEDTSWLPGVRRLVERIMGNTI